MDVQVQSDVNHLLTKAGNLRHAAIATSMLPYRTMLLKATQLGYVDRSWVCSEFFR
jgi:hypothetical protein